MGRELNLHPVVCLIVIGTEGEASARDEGKEPVVLTFPNALAKEATAPLRAAGFRFNKVFEHWEGLARFDEAEQLAGANGGTARGVAPLPSPAKLDTAAE